MVRFLRWTLWRSMLRRGPARGGSASAATRRVVRRKRKTAVHLVDRGPGTSSAVPLLPLDQDARDLRPHPPHGGAARAYTSNRSRVTFTVPRMVTDAGRPVKPPSRPRERASAGRTPSRSPPRSRPSSPRSGTTASSAACARSRRPTCRRARSPCGSSGRASTTRTRWRRSPAARSPGSTRSSRASTSRARSWRARTAAFRAGRPGHRPRLRPGRQPARRLQHVPARPGRLGRAAAARVDDPRGDGHRHGRLHGRDERGRPGGPRADARTPGPSS